MECVFIHGPVASGKLTVARALRARTGLPLHHNHLAVDAALSLFAFGSPAFCRLRERYWLAAFEAAAAARQPFIFTFAPEATVRRALIDELVAVVEAAGGRVRFVELTCARATIEQRLAAAERARFGKLTSPEEHRRLAAEGAFAFPPLPPPLLTLATDSITPDEAAHMIHAALVAAREPDAPGG